MFWDGSRWVDQRPKTPPRRPRPKARLVDWIATIPIVVLVPLLFSPFISARAAQVQLSVSGIARPGSTITATGTGWPARGVVQLTWDGSTAGMPTARITPRGAFSVSLMVPRQATPAAHVLGARGAAKADRSAKLASTGGSTVEAAITVQVLSSEPEGTPSPTSSPTEAPTPGTTPTSAPVVTLPPTSNPTVAPTPTLFPPTAAPTPTLGPPTPTDDPTPEPTPTRTPSPTPTRTPSPTPPPTPPPTPQPTPPPGPDLTFAAECGGSSLDSRLRALYVPGDPGFGLDSDFMGDLRQVSVLNGFCRITAERRSTPSGRAYASACLSTFGTFAQKYGVFEARIRYPKGAGVWPAFWLLAAGSKQTPPEVDIFEAYPGPGTGSSGPSVAVFSNHYPGDVQYVAFDGGRDLTGDWHVWRLEWTSSAMKLKLDGVTVGTLSGHVPNVAMYPIINLALGAPGYRVGSTTPDTLYMDIDYLRVYSL